MTPTSARRGTPRLDAFLDSFAAGPAASDESAGLSAAVGRMQAGALPFPHGVIDGFWPEELYQAVQRDWPQEGFVTPAIPSAIGGPSGYVGSHATKLLESRQPGESAYAPQGTWTRVSQALRHPAFVQNLFTAFAGAVEENLAAGDGTGVPGFRLYLSRDRGADEALGAHVDALRKLLTVVIYVGLDGTVDEHSQQAWGTSLYGTDDGPVVPLEFSRNDARNPEARIAFAPNRAFVMPNTSHSLHGVAGGQEGVTRRTIMCGYWLFSADA
jgi:hypothetical protein